MSSLFSILDMGRRTMQSYQAAIQTSEQNISSAGDPTYHRQVAVIRPTPGMPYRGPSAFSRAIQLGTGGSLTSITRRRDIFVENQIRQVDQRLGRLESEELGLSRLEILMSFQVRPVLILLCPNFLMLGKLLLKSHLMLRFARSYVPKERP